jgi:hypothetical protein
MLTDRDIVVKCIAAGGDPATTKVAELAEVNRSPSVQTTRWNKRCER